MRTRRLLRAGLLGAALLSPASLAGAAPRERSEAVAAAERAYREVDFELTARLAEAELKRGNHDLATTARLQLLHGLASAALGRHEEAYRAFLLLLAIEPARKLDDALSPRVRAPYLEARGYWAPFSERLGVDAELRFTRGPLDLRVVDPANLGRTVRVSFTVPGRGQLEQVELGKSDRLSVPLPQERDPDLEYAVTVLDANGNALYERASERVFGEPTQPAAESRTKLSLAAPTAAPSRAPWFITSAGLALVGLGATAGAAAFHVDRERQADQWNSEGCERPGASRGAQCATVNDRIHDSQRWAVGLYAAGGAFLTASLITLLLAPNSSGRDERAASVHCSLDPSGGLGCVGSF